MKKNTAHFLVVIGLFFSASGCFASNNWIPAMVGGPISQGENLLTLRYMADANIELTYTRSV